MFLLSFPVKKLVCVGEHPHCTLLCFLTLLDNLYTKPERFFALSSWRPLEIVVGISTFLKALSRRKVLRIALPNMGALVLTLPLAPDVRPNKDMTICLKETKNDLVKLLFCC
jgi:hypothetical protein